MKGEEKLKLKDVKGLYSFRIGASLLASGWGVLFTSEWFSSSIMLSIDGGGRVWIKLLSGLVEDRSLYNLVSDVSDESCT